MAIWRRQYRHEGAVAQHAVKARQRHGVARIYENNLMAALWHGDNENASAIVSRQAYRQWRYVRRNLYHGVGVKPVA